MFDINKRTNAKSLPRKRNLLVVHAVDLCRCPTALLVRLDQGNYCLLRAVTDYCSLPNKIIIKIK